LFIHKPTTSEIRKPDNPGPRFYIGLAVFVLSFFMLPIGIVLKSFVIDHFWKGFVLAAFWISAPIMKISSIAILGKASYLWIQYQIHFIYHHVAKPHQVTPLRYNIGLVLFILPFLPNYMFSFMPQLLPDSMTMRYIIIISADMVFLSSLFVLGGDFWDKLRSLFIYTARAKFEEEPEADPPRDK
jgi:hypothetical protein